MKYNVITGMSKEYYDKIGNMMIETWLKYWPADFILTVYTEDVLEINNPRINIVSLDTMDEEYFKFQDSKLKVRAKTFAKKAWPIMQNLDKEYGKLIWVDADVITIGQVTAEWIDSISPVDLFSAHLGVPQASYYAVETGFFVINLENKFKEKFKKKYKDIYYNRDFNNMKKPFDGDVFGRIVTELRAEEKNFTFRDLSPTRKVLLSPFNAAFKDIMMHYKAGRKDEVK